MKTQTLHIFTTPHEAYTAITAAGYIDYPEITIQAQLNDIISSPSKFGLVFFRKENENTFFKVFVYIAEYASIESFIENFVNLGTYPNSETVNLVSKNTLEVDE